jgi:hypothetical protein
LVTIENKRFKNLGKLLGGLLMQLRTSTTVAIYCHKCLKIEYKDLSLFQIKKEGSETIFCGCGAPIAKFYCKNHKLIYFKINCSLCEESHIFTFTFKQLFQTAMQELACPHAEVEIAFLGQMDKIEAYLNEMMELQEDKTESNDEEDYFQNPGIMYHVLDRLYELAEVGNLSCSCKKNHVEIEVFPDRLELRCQYCNAFTVFMTKTAEDYQYIKDLKAIELKKTCFKLKMAKLGILDKK